MHWSETPCAGAKTGSIPVAPTIKSGLSRKPRNRPVSAKPGYANLGVLYVRYRTWSILTWKFSAASNWIPT